MEPSAYLTVPGPVGVVGARGFIGSAVSRRFDSLGIDTVAFTRGEPLFDGERLHPGAATLSAVVWCASLITPAIANQDPEAVLRERTLFNQTLRALETLPDAPQLLLLSSGGTVYGSDGAPFYEDAPLQPLNKYGAARAKLEEELAKSGLRGTILRVTNAYGPGQRPGKGQGVLGYWLAAAARHEPLLVIGETSTARDFIYIDDIVDAIVAAIQRSSQDQTRAFNIGSGHPTSLGALLELVLAIVPEPVKLQRVPGRGFDIPANYVATERARRELGWQAAVPLEVGIARQWEWTKQQLSEGAGLG